MKRILLIIICAIITGAQATWSADFITDVMVCGGDDDMNDYGKDGDGMTIDSQRANFLLANVLFNPNSGDVNGDKKLTVADVMMLVNYILGHANDNFIIGNADVNGDGNITVTDVMLLVNIILNGKSTFKLETNIEEPPINYGGGGTEPARAGENHIGFTDIY